MRIRSLLVLTILFGTLSAVLGQSPSTGVKASVLTGEVASISESKIVLQTKDGFVDVVLSDKTQFKRVPPENPSITAAVAAAVSDIGSGDKLMVTGILSEDKKTLPARAVYLMTKADIAQRQVKESEKWTTRGISGRVATVNTQTNQISVEVRGLANTTTVVLSPKADARFSRYSPGSVKYSEAKSSSIAEIQPGDMLRAAGDKSADGASFAAEEIITGAFQTIAGTVKTVDAGKNEVVVTDAQSNKDVTVFLGSASMLKKFPEEMAQRMAQFQTARAGGARPSGQPGAGQAQGGAQRPAGQGRGGFGGGGRGGIDEMLERFPNITAADLKMGDVIAVSSSKTSTPDRINAIKLLSGVEPFLKAAQAQAANSGQRGRGGVQGSFTIPGLDGFDIP